jgi:hypothetical protein
MIVINFANSGVLTIFMITVLRRTEGKLTVSAVCLAPAHLVDDGGDRLGLKVTLEGD